MQYETSAIVQLLIQMIAASLLPSRRVSVNGKVGDGRASSAPRGGGWVRAVLGGSAFGAGVLVGKGSSSSRSSPFGVTRALTHACVSACVFEAPILGKVGAIAPEPFLAS